MKELFSLTDINPTTATTIDRKEHSVVSISNLPLPLFLDSLCFDKFCIKYTKEQIITLISYLQSIYPQIFFLKKRRNFS